MNLLLNLWPLFLLGGIAILLLVFPLWLYRDIQFGKNIDILKTAIIFVIFYILITQFSLIANIIFAIVLKLRNGNITGNGIPRPAVLEQVDSNLITSGTYLLFILFIGFLYFVNFNKLNIVIKQIIAALFFAATLSALMILTTLKTLKNFYYQSNMETLYADPTFNYKFLAIIFVAHIIFLSIKILSLKLKAWKS